MNPFKRTVTIHEYPDGSWVIKEFKNGSIYPDTLKPNARAMIARLSQLLDIGPVAPQTEPERICIEAPLRDTKGEV